MKPRELKPAPWKAQRRMTAEHLSLCDTIALRFGFALRDKRAAIDARRRIRGSGINEGVREDIKDLCCVVRGGGRGLAFFNNPSGHFSAKQLDAGQYPQADGHAGGDFS
jgi:hypothetical protein